MMPTSRLPVFGDILPDLTESSGKYEEYVEMLTCPECRKCALGETPFQPNRTFNADASEWAYKAACKECNHNWWVCIACSQQYSCWRNANRHTNRSKRRHLDRLEELRQSYRSAEVLDTLDISDPFPTNQDYDEPMHSFLDESDEGEPMNMSLLSDSTHDDSTARQEDADTNTTNSNWLKKLVEQEPPNRFGDLVEPGESLPVFDPGSPCALFFQYEVEHPGEGARYLIGKALNVDPEAITQKEEVFFLKMSNLLSSLSVHQRKELGDLFLEAVNSKDDELGIFKTTRCPSGATDFEKIFWGRKAGIISNLPVPKITKTPDGAHAVTSLLEILAFMLAWDTPVDEFSRRTFRSVVEIPTSISQTKVAYELFILLEKQDDGSFVLYLWIKEWCDDFDPDHTKSTRFQIWMKTFTICPPSNSTGQHNTFVAALGSKGDDHEEVERMFTRELESLQEGKIFYHGGLKRNIMVRAGIVTTCVDRPERTKLFSVGDHNGTYSVCWSYAASIDGKCRDNHLPRCPFCSRKAVADHLGLDLPPAMVAATSASVPPLSGKDSVKGHDSDSSKGDESDDSISDTTNGTASQISSTDGEDAPDMGPTASSTCPIGVCSSWTIVDESFSCMAPAKFPLVFDNSPDAPRPPVGREITGESNKQRRLPGIYITLDFLKEAAFFAWHNLRTRPPEGHANARFWSKSVSDAFLRTCGIVKKLRVLIYKRAREGCECPIPTVWNRAGSLKRCHYAAMHMLFLGHSKSNYNMIAKWLKGFDLFTKFGEAANRYLRSVSALRLRHFQAHPLSTATFGTGSFVAENYGFFARATKFFFSLPTIRESKKLEKAEAAQEYKVVRRFIAAQQAVMGHLLSADGQKEEIDFMVKIYLDCMVEMDQLLANIGSSDDADDAAGGNTQGDATCEELGGRKPGKRQHGSKKGPNWTKSNSLGLLAAAEAHDYFGPAILHWEGGFSGERKIQDVKPHLGIRRAGVNWEEIVLRRIYQNETIDRLLSRAQGDESSTSRSVEGLVHIYKTHLTAVEAVDLRKGPLSAVLTRDGRVCLAYHPQGDDALDGLNRRSQINLFEVSFQDAGGKDIGECYFAPLKRTNFYVRGFASREHLNEAVDQYVLLLPAEEAPNRYKNLYYAIGDKWTERVRTGTNPVQASFVRTPLPVELLKEWLLQINNLRECSSN